MKIDCGHLTIFVEIKGLTNFPEKSFFPFPIYILYTVKIWPGFNNETTKLIPRRQQTDTHTSNKRPLTRKNIYCFLILIQPTLSRLFSVGKHYEMLFASLTSNTYLLLNHTLQNFCPLTKKLNVNRKREFVWFIKYLIMSMTLVSIFLVFLA